MRMERRWNGMLRLALALGAAILTGSNASASTMIKYTTSGAVGSENVTGSNVITFKSLPSATFGSPSFFSLGDFQVAALPSGTSTTYDNTSFQISLMVDEVDGVVPDPNQSPLVITGKLDGTVTGSNQSTVRAIFDPIGEIGFRTGNVMNYLTLPVTDVYLVPSTTNNGVTTAEGHLRTVPVPEPTSIAFFLLAIAGFGARQRLRSRSVAS